MMAQRIRVYIVILNWNGWKDTLECLEAVFRLDYPNYRIVVCDNDSKDGSLDYVKAWAEGKLDVVVEGKLLSGLIRPPVVKPIRYVEYDRAAAEMGGMAGDDSPLVLIQTGGNLGFAGGNNVGLRYAQACGDMAYAWLLNNDTVVKPDALLQMVRRMQEMPDAGICGSTLLYYSDPNAVQVLGGARYSRWRARFSPIGFLQPADAPRAVNAVEEAMAYVAGASMLVSVDFLKDVGLMCEDYFLYFEEADWACRAGKSCYRLAYAKDSIVYHKEGASIGTDSLGQRSVLSTYYLYKNRVRFIGKFYTRDLLFAYVDIIASIARALLKGKTNTAGTILAAVVGVDVNVFDRRDG